MAEYKVVHWEENVLTVFLEADSEEEALEKYHFMVDNGEVDFADMEMTKSADKAVRLEVIKVPVTKISGRRHA